MTNKILIVDQDTYFTDAIVDLLGKEGYEVFARDNLVESQSVIKDAQLDIVILSLTSDMFYKQQVKSIKEADPDISIIGIIADDSSQQITDALKMGVSDFIIKPIMDINDFLKTIEKSVELKTLKAENKMQFNEIKRVNKHLEGTLEVIKTDLLIGSELQRKMLPENGMCWNNIEFNYKSHPSHYLSGDFIGYHHLDDNQCLFYLLDVAGHGASAAFVALLAYNIIDNYRQEVIKENKIADPSELVSKINKEIINTDMGKHLVGVFGVINLKENKLIYCNAGLYPKPMFVSNDSISYLEKNGMAIGLFEDIEYTNCEIEIQKNDRFILMSDGIFEVMDNKSTIEKEKDLLDAVKLNSNLDYLEDILIGDNDELLDDITILQLKINSI